MLRDPKMPIWDPGIFWLFPGEVFGVPKSEMPSVLLGIPWPALRGPLRNQFWRKRRPQPYWGGDNPGNALEASNALNYRVWGIPAVLSRGIPGNALRAFPGSFRNSSGISSGKSQPYWGYGLPNRVFGGRWSWYVGQQWKLPKKGPTSKFTKSALSSLWGPKWLQTYLQSLGINSQLPKTSVTQGFLAGIILCNSGASTRYFLWTPITCKNFLEFILQLHANVT